MVVAWLQDLYEMALVQPNSSLVDESTNQSTHDVSKYCTLPGYVSEHFHFFVKYVALHEIMHHDLTTISFAWPSMNYIAERLQSTLLLLI